MTRQQFEASVIAQHDDEDYQESGFVACVHLNIAYLARYSHCSCYGTFTALCGGGISDSFENGDVDFDWSGAVHELVIMARCKADPSMPDRIADEKDYDYDHLCEVYRQVIEWSEKAGKAK